MRPEIWRTRRCSVCAEGSHSSSAPPPLCGASTNGPVAAAGTSAAPCSALASVASGGGGGGTGSRSSPLPPPLPGLQPPLRAAAPRDAASARGVQLAPAPAAASATQPALEPALSLPSELAPRTAGVRPPPAHPLPCSTTAAASAPFAGRSREIDAGPSAAAHGAPPKAPSSHGAGAAEPPS
eukprot:359275-Chlamydomonas_euryale.AAC.2